MRKYKLQELRELVRLGMAEDYTNKPKRRPPWAVSVTGSRRSPDDGREKRS